MAASQLNCEVVFMPLADGGDGTLAVWLNSQPEGHWVTRRVSGPRGQHVEAAFGLSGQTALIEMARASGIELITPTLRDPLFTTTFGTGELIGAAIDAGATEILVGVGGSATVDGGAGCLQALGARLLDTEGNDVPHGGGGLAHLAHIDVTPLTQRLEGVTIKVLCDVDNPLLGERGAGPVFGPQKGANAEAVKTLAANLAHYADILKHDVGVDIGDMPRTGAAGGLSAGLMAVARAELVSGIETIIIACGYDVRLAVGDIALVITGEGKLDDQSEGGKAPVGMALAAHAYNIPVVALAGTLDASATNLQRWHIASAQSIIRHPCTLDNALKHADEWLIEAATQLGNVLALGQGLSLFKA